MRSVSSESESNPHSIIDCQNARGVNKRWHFNQPETPHPAALCGEGARYACGEEDYQIQARALKQL